MQTGFTVLNNQSFLQKLFIRFFACYFFIFIFPFPVGYIPCTHTLNKWYNTIFDWLISFTGKYIFHINFPLAATKNGSGDTSYNYVQLFLFVVFAAIAIIIWSIADRKQKGYDHFLRWIFIYIRFYLALMMIRYGLEKIIKTQFPFPFFSLNEMYSESSPMRLLWTFMGYSTAYNLFTGTVEIIGGLLLLLRKSTTFGALFCITVLTNVVVINFCFDVPVKLFSLNLLLIAVFIAIPHIKKVINFFFCNKPVTAFNVQQEFKKGWMNMIWGGAKFILIIYIIYSTIIQVWGKYKTTGDGAFQKTPLFGIYNVERFVKNNDTLLPLVTDSSQWKTLNIIFSKRATVKMMNDSIKTYNFFTDTSNKKIQFYSNNDKANKSTLSYYLPDSTHFILYGKLRDDSVYIMLYKQNLNKLELLNRGFHWINEYPHNK